MLINGLPQRVTPTPRGRADLTCPECKYRMRVNVSAQFDTHCPLTVDSDCGHQYAIVIDTTRLLRTPTQLIGSYAKFHKLGSHESGFVDIKELSVAGITFRARTYHAISIGDILRVRFSLDKTTSAEISKSIMVRQIQGDLISGDFCDKDPHDKALASYLKTTK